MDARCPYPLLILLIVPFAAASVDVSLSSPTEIGCGIFMVDVFLKASEPTPIDHFEITIQFDPHAIQYAGAEFQMFPMENNMYTKWWNPINPEMDQATYTQY